jgi:hypothetical protein
LPARHAADPHEIRHDVIAGFHLQGGVERARPVEILADLERCLQVGGQSCVALEVVIDDGLLDPGEAEIIDRVTPFERLAELKSLVEIDHQAHFAPNRLADGLDRREVVGDTLAAKTQLPTLEPALVSQLDGLSRNIRGRSEPEAIAVVSGHGAGTAPEQHAERYAGRPRQGIPGRHVDAATATIDMPS